MNLTSAAFVFFALWLSAIAGLSGDVASDDHFAMERLLKNKQLSKEEREERAFQILEAATAEKTKYSLDGVEGEGEITMGNSVATVIGQLCLNNEEPVYWQTLIAKRIKSTPPSQFREVLNLCMAFLGGSPEIREIAHLVERRDNRPLCRLGVHGLRMVGTLECVQILREIANSKDTATLRYENGQRRFYYPIREYATRMLVELGAPVNPCPTPSQDEVITELLRLMDLNVHSAVVGLGALRTPEAKAALLAFIAANEGEEYKPVVSEAESQVKDMVRAEQEKKEIEEM